MKLNHLAVIIISFIIISLLLSILKIFSITLLEILSYSLITIGISIVYGEVIKQNKILIFLGSILFLLGIFFLITENFNVQTNEGMITPVILISTGAGLLIVYIITSVKNILLILSAVLLSAGLTFLLLKSHWSVDSFIQSILPVLNFLWPVFIILIVLILLLRNR